MKDPVTKLDLAFKQLFVSCKAWREQIRCSCHLGWNHGGRPLPCPACEIGAALTAIEEEIKMEKPEEGAP